ncbi:MAG TPA: hypothetical protein VGH90_00805, partial [Chthoniobacteraceae bacterium]
IAIAEGAPEPRIAAVFIPETVTKFLSILKAASETLSLSGPTRTIAKNESYEVKSEDFTPPQSEPGPQDKNLGDAQTNQKSPFPPFDLSVKPSARGASTIDLQISPKMNDSSTGGIRTRSVTTELSMYENQTVLLASIDPAKKDRFLLLFITVSASR